MSHFNLASYSFISYLDDDETPADPSTPQQQGQTTIPVADRNGQPQARAEQMPPDDPSVKEIDPRLLTNGARLDMDEAGCLNFDNSAAGDLGPIFTTDVTSPAGAEVNQQSVDEGPWLFDMDEYQAPAAGFDYLLPDLPAAVASAGPAADPSEGIEGPWAQGPQPIPPAPGLLAADFGGPGPASFVLDHRHPAMDQAVPAAANFAPPSAPAAAAPFVTAPGTQVPQQMYQPAFAPATLDFPVLGFPVIDFPIMDLPGLNFPLDPAPGPHFPAAACHIPSPDAPPAGFPAPNHPGAAHAWVRPSLPGPVNGLHGGGGVAASFGPGLGSPFALAPPAPPTFPPAAPAAEQAAPPDDSDVANTEPTTGPLWARNEFKKLAPAVQELVKKGRPGSGNSQQRRRKWRYQKMQQ